MKTMMTMTTTMRILWGWRPVSTESCKAHRKPTFPHRAQGLPTGRRVVTARATKRRCLLTARVLIRPLPPPRAGPPFRHDLPKRLARAIGSRPLEQGR